MSALAFSVFNKKCFVQKRTKPYGLISVCFSEEYVIYNRKQYVINILIKDFIGVLMSAM